MSARKSTSLIRPVPSLNIQNSFEIACYKNKAINWRNGIEKDLNEVLQSYAVYRNADQGEQASADELKEFFPGLKMDDVIKTILEKGELDIGEEEREQQKDSMEKEIANLIAERVVHPDSKRPFSVESIKAALKSIHFAPKLNEPVKKQVSDATKKLIAKYYIARAEMKIKLTIPSFYKSKLLTELNELKVKPENTLDEKDNFTAVCLIEPSLYRALDELLKKKLGEGSMEIVTRSVMKKEATDLENAGVANLQIREKPLEEEKSDSEDEGHNNKKGAKKGKKGKKDQASKKKHNDSDDEGAKKKEEKISLAKEEPAEPVMEIAKSKEAEKKFKCSSCKDASFDTNAEFRTHFKTDWHNFNNKRKIEKKEPVTEDEFLDQLLDDEVTMKKRDR